MTTTSMSQLSSAVVTSTVFGCPAPSLSSLSSVCSIYFPPCPINPTATDGSCCSYLVPLYSRVQSCVVQNAPACLTNTTAVGAVLTGGCTAYSTAISGGNATSVTVMATSAVTTSSASSSASSTASSGPIASNSTGTTSASSSAASTTAKSSGLRLGPNLKVSIGVAFGVLAVLNLYSS